MFISYTALGTLLILILWALGSYLVVRNIEKPVYTVVSEHEGYEIREYKNYIVAETTVPSGPEGALSSGFRVIADYIFGNNVSRTSIAMTAPVLETPAAEKIAMTTPVLSTPDRTGDTTVAFVLPSLYTLDTLPRPNNSAVTIREVPAHKVAAVTFTWYATATRLERKKAQLLSALARDKVTISGEVSVAQYNPPLSMPLVLRNELLVPVQ
ncbi:heme-binding protein [Patescibacteria group bacterium]|nr:heme-binding protein [Patescibacteria group bacterium]